MAEPLTITNMTETHGERELDSRRKGVFLATTALEEFWDTSKPILFLGPWCLRYRRRSFWESLGGRCVRSPWHDEGALHKAYCYTKETYELLLPLMSEVLNSIHHRNYSTRAWRIVIGPWLWHYIAVIYDRYQSLKVAEEDLYDFTTICLSAESFATSSDTLDFVLKLKEDLYNLQIYTRILLFLGKKFPDKPMELRPQTNCRGDNVHFLRRLPQLIAKSASSAVFRVKPTGKSIILKDDYFSSSVKLQLMVKTFGEALPISTNSIELGELPLNWEARSQLQRISLGETEFHALLVSLLPHDIPQSFIEGFEAIGERVKEVYPSSPRAILTCTAWYYDELFKRWAADLSGKGVALIGSQHGGNYGLLSNLYVEEHELAICDRYYSWGWTRSGRHAQVVPFAATKLAGRKSMTACNQKDGILMVTTIEPRYLLHFPFVPSAIEGYWEWQRRFIQGLGPKPRGKLRVRVDQVDLGWDVVQRWEDLAPDVPLERWDVTFLRSLENCRLCVCDNLSTTFAEALAANKPTVLFWAAKTYELRPEALRYIDQLHATGILFYAPESAATAVNSLYDDVDGWWNQKNLQTIRREFCERFARTSPNAVSEWAAELRRIANGHLLQ